MIEPLRRCQYEDIAFAVSANGSFRVEVQGAISNNLRKKLVSGTGGGINFGNLLPLAPGKSWKGLLRWQKTTKGVDEIVKIFDAAVVSCCGKHLADTDFGKLLAQFAKLSFEESVGTPQIRLLCQVSDGRCVIPWEILVHYYCSSGPLAPIVYSRTYESSGRRPSDAYFDVLLYQDCAEAMNQNEAFQENAIGTGEVRFAKKGVNKREGIQTLANIHDSAVHIVIGSAMSDGCLFLPPRSRLARQDIKAGVSPAAICAIIPVVFGRMKVNSNGWTAWSRSAQECCQDGILGLSATIPLPPRAGAFFARNILLAAASAEFGDGRTAALAVAEKLLQNIALARDPAIMVLTLQHIALAGDIRSDLKDVPLGSSGVDVQTLVTSARGFLAEGYLEEALLALSKAPVDVVRSPILILLYRFHAGRDSLAVSREITSEQWETLRSQLANEALDLCQRLERNLPKK
jgi:hypothetical protein